MEEELEKINLRQANKMLLAFGIFKIPLIGFCRPKIISISYEHLHLRIPLNWMTRNHLKSMYLGTLSIGADLASGLLVYQHFNQRRLRASMAFKSMQVEFLKRAESDVIFKCEEGEKAENMVLKSAEEKERINDFLLVEAFDSEQELVATFNMEVSVRVKS